MFGEYKAQGKCETPILGIREIHKCMEATKHQYMGLQKGYKYKETMRPNAAKKRRTIL